MIDKRKIRKEIQATRDNLSQIKKSSFDKKLCDKLIKIISERNAKIVHTYISIKSEVNIFPVIDYMLSNGITVVAPKALSSLKMSDLILSSIDCLESGVFGTKHPAGNNEYKGTYDLIIVPGLAFDKYNNRIGYGAGYYDYFLKSNISSYKVAIAYPFQIIDKIPFEPHDVKLDKIIF